MYSGNFSRIVVVKLLNASIGKHIHHRINHCNYLFYFWLLRNHLANYAKCSPHLARQLFKEKSKHKTMNKSSNSTSMPKEEKVDRIKRSPKTLNAALLCLVSGNVLMNFQSQPCSRARISGDLQFWADYCTFHNC